MVIWSHRWLTRMGLLKYMKKILIVCEGPTDYVVIDGIFQHIGHATNKSFNTIMLSPQIDATTNTAERHGWTGVKRWCQLYSTKNEQDYIHLPPSIRATLLRKSWESVIAFTNADLLLIQIDTDIANCIDPAFDEDIQSRRDFCENSINLWLAVDMQKDNCKYLLPTFSIETWFLSTYENNNHVNIFTHGENDYECYHNVEKMLISLGYPSKVKGVTRKLKKEPKKYKLNDKYLPRLIANIDVAQDRCAELKRFVALINGT